MKQLLLVFFGALILGAALSAVANAGVRQAVASLLQGQQGPPGPAGPDGPAGAPATPKNYSGDANLLVTPGAPGSIGLATSLSLGGGGLSAASGALDLQLAYDIGFPVVAADGTSYCASSTPCANGGAHAFQACRAGFYPISGQCLVYGPGSQFSVLSQSCLSDGNACVGDYAGVALPQSGGYGWGCRAIDSTTGALVRVDTAVTCVRK